MNATILLFAAALPAAGFAQQSPTAGEAPPVTRGPGAAPAANLALLPGEQQLFAPAGSIIRPEEARAIVEKFKTTYAALGKPRLVFYVNRDLVATESALELTKRTEHTETARTETKSDIEPPAPAAAQTQVNVQTGGPAAAAAVPAGKGSTHAQTERVTAENTYTARPAPALTLADRQTIRDVERLFGRPFRAAGAQLADQKIATSLMADKSYHHFAAADSDAARREREALTKVADVVIEVLVSSRQVSVLQVSGEQTFVVPDIQATAIRLSDSAILGQASSRDVLGKDRDAGKLVPHFDVNDITEATALALMEDMAPAGK
ncbi:MAG: hypothetical protein HY302_15095 [Opitutae bacterium]|nr:hypothetical protein [Opitutae bacterium]